MISPTHIEDLHARISRTHIDDLHVRLCRVGMPAKEFKQRKWQHLAPGLNLADYVEILEGLGLVRVVAKEVIPIRADQ